MILSIIIIFFTTYIIWKSSSSFDIASSYLTRNLGEGIKGPTINAVASSLPELLISFFFLFYIGDLEGFSAGFATIIGSSIFNIAIIPTVSLFVIYRKQGVKLFPTEKKIIEQDGFFLILTEIALLLGLYLGGISIAFATVLILLYCVYIALVIWKRRNHSENKDSKLETKKEVEINRTPFVKKLIDINIAGLVLGQKPINTSRALLILFISLVIISISCEKLVTSSEDLSQQLNLNLFFVTFFIAAVASSIPDTILSIKDAESKKYKDAFSNAYGSNIFDICIGIGLPVLMYLLINDIERIQTTTNLEFTNDILFISSLLLIAFSLPISLIYWLKDLNITRAIVIISLYLSFLGIVFYIS